MGFVPGCDPSYAGRIPAAGRSPAEVQQTIQARLANRALQPQAIVVVEKSFANTVTVTGEVVAGAQVPLSTGGDRLLEVIAAAGGAKAPVYETFVRLSRGGVTATMPLQQLVSDPAENIYAWPGDVLTLVQMPQTFSVLGATGRNAQLPFDAERISLGEALGKSQGLRDDLAKPEGVFLFRYESNAIVRALGQPIASTTPGGVSPKHRGHKVKNPGALAKGRARTSFIPMGGLDSGSTVVCPTDQIPGIWPLYRSVGRALATLPDKITFLSVMRQIREPL
jgi:polysaccharide export outer membrane protein